MSEIKTPEQVLAELQKQPGIEINKLKPGTRVIVETTQGVYQLTVLEPLSMLVSLEGTEQRFKKPVVGQFMQSVYDKEGKLALIGRIGPALKMQIRFKNGTFNTSPALSACVEGDGWHYDVFGL